MRGRHMKELPFLNRNLVEDKGLEKALEDLIIGR